MTVRQEVIIPYTKTTTDQRDRASDSHGEALVEIGTEGYTGNSHRVIRFRDRRTREKVLEVSQADLLDVLHIKGVKP